MKAWRCIQLRALGALSLVAPAALQSQAAATVSVRGQVHSEPRGDPVAGAEVSLVEIGRSVRSGTGGEFVLNNVPLGVHVVRVRFPGFTMLEDTVRVVAESALELRYRLTPIPVPLAPVNIVADSVVELSPLMADFRRRRAGKSGKFLTRTEITKIGSQSLASLVRGHVGGFDLVRHPSGSGFAFASRRAAAPKSFDRTARPPNECYSNVWVNGQLLYFAQPGKMQDPPRIEDFDVTHLNGVEFYRSAAETPLEFNVMSAACGTVAIWMDLR